MKRKIDFSKFHKTNETTRDDIIYKAAFGNCPSELSDLLVSNEVTEFIKGLSSNDIEEDSYNNPYDDAFFAIIDELFSEGDDTDRERLRLLQAKKTGLRFFWMTVRDSIDKYIIQDNFANLEFIKILMNHGIITPSGDKFRLTEGASHFFIYEVWSNYLKDFTGLLWVSFARKFITYEGQPLKAVYLQKKASTTGPSLPASIIEDLENYYRRT